MPLWLRVAALALLGVPAPLHAGGDPGAARAIVTTGSSAMPAWAPDQSRIVFHSRRKSEKAGAKDVATRNVWSVLPDGSDARQLTKGNKDEYHPSLSPDGKKLLFVSELNGSRDIWVADANGENPVPLTDDPGTEDQPAWGPDSRQIAYAAFPKEGGSFDLWLVNVDGSGRRRLTTTPANEIFPVWHPNGQLIAYVTDAGGNFDIHTIDVRDGRTVPLIVSPDHEARPAWSPDGTKIAFVRWPARGRTSQSALWVANADGTAPIELTAAPAPATHPMWAPDGRQLAFQHRGDTGWEIWTLDLPGDIAHTGHLRLAQQVRGGADVDTVRLRGGETIRGTVTDTRFPVRAAYGAVDLARPALASVVFAGGERGLGRFVLANGDTVTGFPEMSALHVTVNGKSQEIDVERLAEVSLRTADGTGHGGHFRAVMRNGDSLVVADLATPLRLRVGDRPMDVEAKRVDRVEFDEDGERASVVLVGGDTVAGKLGGTRVELVLAAGPRLAVHPGSLRSLVRTEP